MSVQQTLLDTPIKPLPSYSLKTLPIPSPVPAPSDTYDADIVALVNSMSLKEKIGQMTQIESGQFINQETGEYDEKLAEMWVTEWGIGSVLDAPNNHGGKYYVYPPKEFADFVDAVQKVAVEKGSKKIPIMYGLDSLHGANYVNGAVIFPQPLATAATFNPKFAEDAGQIAAKDTRAVGIQWIFAPCMDLLTSKIFPRTYEAFGEDPYLSGLMSAASVRGLQGDYKNDRTRVAACMKHFIGYAHPLNGWDKGTSWIPDHHLLEYFVPPFQACVDAGVASCMECYNDVNGEPVVTSEFYLKEVLRNRMGFKGMLVTDWAEIDHTIEFHHTSTDRMDATMQAITNTSIDMSMVPIHSEFSSNLHELVTSGKIPESRITESALKILQLKKDLGIFESPFCDRKIMETVGSEQDIELALNSIRESITLLKNEGSLPLATSDKVFLTGPTANSIGYLSGGWTLKWQGAHDREHMFHGRGKSILTGMKELSGDVEFIRGVDINGEFVDPIETMVEKAKETGKAIVCLGEDSYAENFGNITDMTLPKGQLDLIRKIKAEVPTCKIILILVEGRPRLLEEVVELCDAVIDVYLPGPWGGLPIAEVLYGKVNPSGRLPFSYPRHHSDTFITYYLKNPQQEYNPLFPFGAGISYSKITYSNLVLSSDEMSLTEKLKISLDISNDGPFDVKEPVLLYVTPTVRPGLVPERKRLRDVQKVDISKGQKVTVSFEIGVDQLKYVGRSLEKVTPFGLKYKVVVNANRKEGETLSGFFSVKKQ